MQSTATGNSLNAQVLSICCLPAVGSSGIQTGHRPRKFRSQALESPNPRSSIWHLHEAKNTCLFFSQHPFSAPMITMPLWSSRKPSLWLRCQAQFLGKSGGPPPCPKPVTCSHSTGAIGAGVGPSQGPGHNPRYPRIPFGPETRQEVGTGSPVSIRPLDRA